MCHSIDNNHFNEIEVKKNENTENISETQAVVPTGRKLGILKHTYTTRRSARLDLNTIKVEEGSEIVKTELLSNGKFLKMNVKEHSPAESHPITETLSTEPLFYAFRQFDSFPAIISIYEENLIIYNGNYQGYRD